MGLSVRYAGRAESTTTLGVIMIFVGFVLIAISFLCTWLGQPLWVIVGCAALGLLLICLRVIARR